jgi:hypothetical protein
MKKIILSFLAIVMVVGFSNNVVAQNTAVETADATATIVAPITITKTTDLQFGTIVKGVGNVEVTPAGTRSHSISSTYLLTEPTTDTDVTAAVFAVAGEGAYTFSIDLPENGVVTIDDGDLNTMDVNDFTSNGTDLLGDTDAALIDGTFTLNVGATLTVTDGATQASGLYTGTFDVTVAYN